MPAVRGAILAFTEPGDEVVIQPPVYYPFTHAVQDNARTLLLNPLICETGRYRMDLEQLESIITPRTRLLLLCSPHNPVGRVWTANELRALGEVCERHDLIIISDEIHGDIIRPGSTFFPMAAVSPAIAERTISCISPSKTFNIAGLASAFAVIPNRGIRKTFQAAMGRLGLEIPNTLSLTAGSAAYSGGEEWLEALLEYIHASAEWFAAELARTLPAVRLSPIEGTYLAWLDLRGVMEAAGASDETVHRALLDVGALWLSDGARFGQGGSGFQRMNLACPRSMVADGIERLARALESLS
jgi:cystathionine beta-lyase